MSDTPASLRRKIDRAADLQSVVRTMKALAASSIGQYERSVRALADYYRTVELGLATCLRDTEAMPSAPVRHRQASAVVVFGSDQGLVGQFNEIVVEYALRTVTALPGSPAVWAVGERVHARLQEAGLAVTGRFRVPGSVETIAPLIGRILVETEKPLPEFGVVDLHLVYNRRTLGSAYAPVGQRLLPLDEDWRRPIIALAWPTANLPEVVGSRTTTLRALVREYVFVSLFRACAESLASENASRLSAMECADKNIDELLQDLHTTFHRLRQSNIDEELFDVVAGYEALSSGLSGAATPVQPRAEPTTGRHVPRNTTAL